MRRHGRPAGVWRTRSVVADAPATRPLIEAVARARCARSIHVAPDDAKVDQAWRWFAEGVERDLRDFEAAGFVVLPQEPDDG
jgi:hypothetical protein